MTDIEEIIASFQGVERKEILSSTQTDLFLDLVSQKENWTIEEYNQVRLAYDLNYMSARMMDYFAFYKIKNKYKFNRTWDDYFKILDSIKTVEKQKKYINYYFWYHGSQIDSNVYELLLLKPYFKYLILKNKVKFLKEFIRTNENTNWVKEKFSSKEIKLGLIKNSLYVLNNTDIREFYHSYKTYMNDKTKLKLFYSVVKSGSLEMIDFLYPEIKKINKLHLICNVGADTAQNTTLETLYHLESLGVEFKYQDLIKTKEMNAWPHLEYKEEIIHFFESLRAEKRYNQLDNKLEDKCDSLTVNKI